MFNLEKLNELKDLDVDKLLKLVVEYQNVLIRIVLIIGSLLMAGNMFTDYSVKSKALSTQMSDAQQKIAAIKDRDAAVVNINNFKSSIPQNLTESELITLISQFAKSYNVTITSLTPGGSDNLGLYDLLDVAFDASSNSFKNILLFIRKIETSKFPLRIDSWSGQETESKNITFRIKIDAVLIHT